MGVALEGGQNRLGGAFVALEAQPLERMFPRILRRAPATAAIRSVFATA